MSIIDEGHLRADAMQLLSRCPACSWPCMRNPGAVAHAGRGFERLLADSIARPAPPRPAAAGRAHAQEAR